MFQPALALLAFLHSDSGRFEQKMIAVDGDVKEVVAADLDGDGRKDLLALYTRGVAPKETRHFAIFWNRSGRYYERPDELFAVPSDACAFDVAELDDQPGEELLSIGSGGVSSRSFAGRKLTELHAIVRSPTLFSQADTGTLPRLHIVHDIAKPRSRDLIVLASGALEIYRRAEAGAYERAARLVVTLESSIEKPGKSRSERKSSKMSSISVTLRFPAVTVIDTDADGLRDVVLSLDDRIAVYRQAGELVFSTQPSLSRDFAVRTEADRKEAYSWIGVSVVDLDADGAADLVVRKNVAHGIASAEATNYLFLGRRGGAYPARPDQILKNEGAGRSDVELYDITGDGLPDLIVPTIDIGIMTIITNLTSKTIDIDTHVYSFDAKKRRFSDKPVAERELEFDLSLEGEADNEAFDMTGDYDGDHKPDLVFATEEGELSIFRGLGGGTLFAEDATDTIAVRSFGEILSVDLDNRGRSDIVLYYPRTNGHRNEIVIVSARGQ